MDKPIYLEYLTSIFTWLYLYVLIPSAVMLTAWLLITYAINTASGKNREDGIPTESKFRRGVAIFFPFLLSLYAVLMSETYELPIKFEINPIIPFLVGGMIGFAFIYWISNIQDDDELYETLSCLVASLIFFSICTVFVITKSFVVISFVIGFLAGACVYIIRYGFSRLDRLKFKIPNFIKNFSNKIITSKASPVKSSEYSQP